LGGSFELNGAFHNIDGISELWIVLEKRTGDADLLDVFQSLVKERRYLVEALGGIEEKTVAKLIGPVHTHVVDEGFPKMIRTKPMFLAV
jgi:hypothetical protein